MIEIIALVLLTRKIGLLAVRKGQKPGVWKLYTVLAWLGFEVVGIFIGLSINGKLLPSAMLGIGLAVGGYLLVQYRLERLPDAPDNDWLQRLGRDR